MKLNTKRVIFVGFAFFLICAFWQAYDAIVPKILTDKFGMSQTNSGIIMALDNILALFLLPLFGTLSDKTESRLGRRSPYILTGTLIAVATLVCLTFVDNAQLKKIEAVATIDDPASMALLYDHDYKYELQTTEGETFVLTERFTKEAFVSIRSVTDDKTNADYTNFVVPARQAYIREITLSDPSTLILFIAILLVLLLAMGTFRSPAVALMPDVTIKPLRSKANAIINLMGTFGGILILGLGIVFKTGNVKYALMSYSGFFMAVAAIMVIALILFLINVKEPLFVREMQVESKRYGIEEAATADTSGKRKLSKGELISLIFILASVALWYMGYNAVTSKYSVYAGKVLGLDFNLTLMVANVAAILSYIPVGIISSKFGRKKTILAGIIMLTASFLTAAFMREGSPAPVMNLMFALAGIGWATINVNSFPMVVELAKGGDVGRYTGYYYTASMAAQTFTPYFSGLLMDKIGMTTLFPYATIFIALAFVTMLLVRHGDSRPQVKASKLEMLDND